MEYLDNLWKEKLTLLFCLLEIKGVTINQFLIKT